MKKKKLDLEMNIHHYNKNAPAIHLSTHEVKAKRRAQKMQEENDQNLPNDAFADDVKNPDAGDDSKYYFKETLVDRDFVD